MNHLCARSLMVIVFSGIFRPPAEIEARPISRFSWPSWSFHEKWDDFKKLIDFCDESDVVVDEESDCHHFLICGPDSKWHHAVCPGNWGFSTYYNTCVPFIQSQCSPTVEQDYYEDWYLEEDNKSKWGHIYNILTLFQRYFQ